MKKIILFCIAICPVNLIRITLYKVLLGYKISYNSKIGMFNYLELKSCSINGANIGRFNFIRIKELKMKNTSRINNYNRFREFELLEMEENSTIRNHNAISGTINSIQSPYKKHEQLKIGEKAIITSHHMIDCSDSIEIGDRVVIGGNGTQLWTHGFTNDRVRLQGPIQIGKDTYIGSRSMLMPSIKIAENSVIAAGTTVSKSITESGVYVSSQLIKKSDVKNLRNSKEVIIANKGQYIRKDIE